MPHPVWVGDLPFVKMQRLLSHLACTDDHFRQILGGWVQVVCWLGVGGWVGALAWGVAFNVWVFSKATQVRMQWSCIISTPGFAFALSPSGEGCSEGSSVIQMLPRLNGFKQARQVSWACFSPIGAC